MKKLSSHEVGTVLWQMTGWIFVVAAAVHAGFFRFLNPGFGLGHNSLITTALHLFRGEPLGRRIANPRDLSAILIRPFQENSPLYSLFLFVLLKFQLNLEWAVTIINWFSVGLFFLSWFLVLEKLNPDIPVKARFLLWVFWGLAYDPLSTGLQPEILALSFFSFGFYLLVAMAKKDVWGALNSLCSGLCFALGAATHYAYWPLGLVGLVSLTLTGIRFKKRWMVAALSNGLPPVLTCAVIVLYNHRLLRQFSFLAPYKNLMKSGDILSAPVLGLNPIWATLSRRAGLELELVPLLQAALTQSAGLLLIILSTAVVWLHLRRKTEETPSSPAHFVFFTFWTAVFFIKMVLPGNYLVLFPALTIVLLLAITNTAELTRNFLGWSAKLLAILLGLACLYNAYPRIRMTLKTIEKPELRADVKAQEERRRFFSSIRQIKKLQPAEPPLLYLDFPASPQGNLRASYATMLGLTPVKLPANMTVSQEVTLVIALPQQGKGRIVNDLRSFSKVFQFHKINLGKTDLYYASIYPGTYNLIRRQR